MSKLTGTHSEVAAYEFTTLTTVPGVVMFKGAKIQVNKGFGQGVYRRIDSRSSWNYRRSKRW